MFILVNIHTRLRGALGLNPCSSFIFYIHAANGCYFWEIWVSFQLYADDTQLQRFLGPLLNCINELQIWLKQNLLVLNENKTEIILFGLKSYEDCAHHFDHLSSYFTPCAKNIGVIFDCNWVLRKKWVQWSNQVFSTYSIHQNPNLTLCKTVWTDYSLVCSIWFRLL